MQNDKVVIGSVGSPFGVTGWNHLNSHTDPASNILNYKDNWLIEINGSWEKVELDACKNKNPGLLIKIKNCNSREDAKLRTNCKIAVPKQILPSSDAETTYWHDLVGCQVLNLENVELGQVDYIFATGSNDVLVVKGERERLIPFTAVCEKDFAIKKIIVDWDADF